jgi:hypothetical protein
MAANTDKAVYSNIGVGAQASVNLLPGQYGMDVHAGTWGGGSVALQKLAADGVTWITVQSFSADGFAAFVIPGGVYQVNVTTATGVYASVSPIATQAT